MEVDMDQQLNVSDINYFCNAVNTHINVEMYMLFCSFTRLTPITATLLLFQVLFHLHSIFSASTAVTSQPTTLVHHVRSK